MATRKRNTPVESDDPDVKKNKTELPEDYDSDSSSSSSHRLKIDLSVPLEDPSAATLPEEVLQTFYKPPGCLLISGLVSWNQVGKREMNPTNMSHPNLYKFHKFTDRRYRLIVSGCTAGHCVLVDENGQAYTFGRNTFGQLGFGDTKTRNIPEPVPELIGKNVIHAATGKYHTLFVTDMGAVYACGQNKVGQCGIGNTEPAEVLTPTRIKYTGMPIVKVGCGSDFSMILDCNGVLHSFGMPENGRLGHNTDGKYIKSANKVCFDYEVVPKAIKGFMQKSKNGVVSQVKDVVIVDLSCGADHTVALDSMKRVFSWGFGGLGRLGHAEQRDETVPRLINTFDTPASRGIRSVHCGGVYSLAVNELGTLYLFGQPKRTGEANMYPKPVLDLSGWHVKHVGASFTSIVVAADESVVAWGPSPTFGELGTGFVQKSSSKPIEVNALQGTKVTQIAAGYSHTLILCDDSTEEVQNKLKEIPTFNPSPDKE